MVRDVYRVHQIVCDRRRLGIQAHKFEKGWMCLIPRCCIDIYNIPKPRSFNCDKLFEIVEDRDLSAQCVSLEVVEFP